MYGVGFEIIHKTCLPYCWRFAMIGLAAHVLSGVARAVRLVVFVFGTPA
jgi:hypothetical protein